MANQSDLNKQIQQEINKLAGDEKRIRQEQLDILMQQNASTKSLKKLLQDIRNEAEGWEETLGNITKQFNKIQKQIQEVNTEENKAKRALNDYNDIQKQILSQKNKQRLIGSQELKDLKSQLNAKSRELQLNAATQAIKDQIVSQTRELNNYLNEEIKKREKIEKNLENVSTILKAMGDIPIFGKLLNISQALEDARRKAEEGGSALAVWETAFKSMGKSLFDNLTNPFNILVFAVQGFFSLLKNVDQSIGDLAKGMNMSYGSTAAMTAKMGEAAKKTGDIYDSVTNWSKSLLAINESLGTSATVSDKTLKTFSNLRDKAGYTNEELASIYKLTLATGGELENNVKSFAGAVRQLNLQNKLRVNEKQLLKDVAKTSDAIKLSVGGTVEAIAKAAFKAKQFGISLEQADKMAEGLLNFEESISNELSAELLTGKDLNLERARLLALNGDIAGASAEILQQIGGSAEFANMNRIQQEAIAKAVGLSRDELAKSLVEREALAAMGAKDAEEAQKILEARAAEVGWAQAIAEQKDQAYAQQLAQNSLAEDMQQIMIQIQEAFIPIAQDLLPRINAFFDKNEGTLKNIVEGIGTFAKSLIEIVTNTDRLSNIFNGIKFILLGIAGLKLGGLIAQLATAAATAGLAGAGAITFASGITLGLGVLAVGAGIAYMMGLFDSASDKAQAKAQQVKDGLVSGGGLVVGKYSEGAIQPIAQGTNSDNVIFTTNKPTSNTNSASAPTATINMDAIVREQQRTNSLLDRLLTKQGVIIDSQKMGTAVDVNTYTVQ